MLRPSAGAEIRRAAAQLWLVVALISGVIYLVLPWMPRIDFDIVGFLWVLFNFPKLAAAAMFLTGLVMAAGLWVRLQMSR